jgi:SAM-dependent methyltransferase
MEKHKLWLLMIAFCCAPLFSWVQDDFSDGKDWSYQDLWIQGEILFKGCGPDCPARYEALRPLLRQFNRPFSVLEIGANNGYFCFRIAADYDATCVLVDGTDRLKRICEANSSKRIIYLEKFVDANDLLKLAETEHFDVVLCFHVLHHVDWKPFFSALQKLGDYLVVETPPVNDIVVSLKPTIPEIAQHLLSIPGVEQIGSFYRSDVKDHMLLFTSPTLRASPPGISLSAFREFNGVYPEVGYRDEPHRWRLTGSDLILAEYTHRN